MYNFNNTDSGVMCMGIITEANSDPKFSRGRYNEQESMPAVHCHSSHELYYLLSGSVKYYIGDEIYDIKQGDCVFIKKGTLHKTEVVSEGGGERILIEINDKQIGDELEGMIDELGRKKVIHIPKANLPAVEDIMFKMEDEIKRGRPGFRTMLDAYSIELIALICRYKQNFVQSINETDKVMFDIAEYINMHYNEDLSLKKVSDIYFVSEGYVSRKFKQVIGMGFSDYISYIRIVNAGKMLKNGGVTMTEVAQKCGFCDSNYFSVVFKRYMGCTPSKFVIKNKNTFK